MHETKNVVQTANVHTYACLPMSVLCAHCAYNVHQTCHKNGRDGTNLDVRLSTTIR